MLILIYKVCYRLFWTIRTAVETPFKLCGYKVTFQTGWFLFYLFKYCDTNIFDVSKPKQKNELYNKVDKLYVICYYAQIIQCTIKMVLNSRQDENNYIN